jgi:hypothetical protein
VLRVAIAPHIPLFPLRAISAFTRVFDALRGARVVR